MGTDRRSKSEILSAAQAVLDQDDRERARSQSRVQARVQPRSNIYVLLKSGLFRSRRAEAPAKTSLLLEGLHLFVALVLVAAILLLVYSRLHHA